MEMVKMSSCCCIAFFLILLYKCKADSYSSRFDEINIPPFSTEYEERKGYMVQYRPGDILIGGLMRVHRRGNEEHCSEIQDDGIQAVETMNMVVDMINANPSILNGIKLGTVMVDTCDVDTHALERAVTVLLPFFFGNDDKANKPPLFTGVVGAASSAVSIQTAGFLQIFKIPQVSMWSTNPTLSSKARFPYFFRTVPSDSYQATAMLALIQKMKWNYISVVYEDDFYGGQGYAEIKEATEKLQICIAAAIAIPRHTTKETFVEIVHQLLQKKRAKAVIVFTKLHDAEKLISAANDNPNARGHFFWIGSDGWSGQVPTGDGGNYLESLDGAIAFSPRTSPIALLDTYMANLTLGQHLSGKDEEERFRNPWFPEYLSETLKCRLKGTNGTGINGRRRKLCRKNDHIDRKKFVALSKMQNVADAVLSIVYSLDVFWKEACGGKGLCDALNQTVQTNWLADQVSGIMKNISFTAINGGMFKFDENLDGPAEYNIKRFNKTLMTATDLRKWTVSGVFHDNEIEWNTSSLPVDNVNSVCSEPCKIGQARIAKASTCCWTCQTCHERQFVRNGTSCSFCPNGSQPTETRDGCIEIETSFTQFDDIHSIVSMVIAVFGIVLTLIIAFVFHTHRNTAIVKASGKELCIFVFIGALLCFANSFVLSVPASLATCFVSRLLICLGPTLMYAALITKTIRVVIIFRTKKILSPHVKKFLLPKYQIMVTFIFVFIQLCVLSVWLGFGYPSTTTIYPDVSTAFRTCTDTEGLVVLVALAYPFLLIVACTVLATVNRNVPTGFNETQYIGFTMYATCVIWFAFLPIFITSSQKLRLKVATLAICVSLSAITVLACLFGYRCYVIMFKPDENTSHSVMSPLESSKASTSQIGRRSAATNEQPQSEATLTPSPISKCETLELSKNEKKKIKFLEPLSPEIEHCIAIAGGKQSQGGAKEMKKKAT